MSEDKFLDDLIHQGEIVHNLSKLKKEELIIGYQHEILASEDKDRYIADLEHKNKILERALELCLFEDAPDYDNESRSYWVDDMKEDYIRQAEKELKGEKDE